MTPLGHGGGPIEFEVYAVVKMTALVEVVVDRSVDGGDVLKSFHISDAQN